MEKFKVGDIVERIDCNWYPISVGDVYKIREVVKTGIKLEGINHYTFDTKHFRLYKEAKVLEILRKWRESR